MNFRSDNEAPAAPEIMAALARANEGAAHSYGADAITARLQERFSELFETEVAVYPVITGTAANSLALAEIAPPYGAVFCHAQSHVHTDECGAPEFYTGGAKLMPLASGDGKITPDALDTAIAGLGFHGDHEPAPVALSFTQASEAGTVYSLDEVGALCGAAKRHRLAVHMDGARFANAVSHLGCAPADLTWRAGVDILSFGATKNGAMAAEAVVDFRPEAARAAHRSLARRRMRGGHLLSKMRYVSAQLEAYVADDLWLGLAAQANAGAARLAEGLGACPGVELLHQVDANEIFLHLPRPVIEALRGDGFEFHLWSVEGREIARLVVPYNVTAGDIDRLINSAGAAARAAA
jgi:threonine aldolase